MELTVYYSESKIIGVYFNVAIYYSCIGYTISFVVDVKTMLKPLYWDNQFYKRFEKGERIWSSIEKDVKALIPEQVEWLMRSFSITPK